MDTLLMPWHQFRFILALPRTGVKPIFFSLSVLVVENPSELDLQSTV